MSFIINLFLALPFWLRVSIFFFLSVVIIGRFLGKYILWCLSIFPFLIQKTVSLLYLLIEIPIENLHKRYGGLWKRIDDGWGEIGKKVSDTLRKWYRVWRGLKNFSFKRLLLIYLLCVFFVVGPSIFNVENSLLKIGETLYVRGESFGISCLEKRGLYVSKQQNVNTKVEEKEEVAVEEMILIVSGVNSSLLVRDMPSTENYTTLERLQNGDIVIWKGELVFSEVDRDHIEPWVKIETDNGTEGWTRLYYLYPKEYKGQAFRLIHE